jgi:curli biogenesis system outer membrane secretion channel CsgG
MKRLAYLALNVAIFPILGWADPATPAPPPAAPATGGLRYSIEVVKFENHAKYTGPFALADCWSAVLTDSLQQTGRFIVIGETDMRAAAVAEQDLARSGRVATGSKTAVTGALTPAQLLIKGEITHFQDGTQSGNGSVGFAGINLGLSSSTSEVNAVVYVVDASTGQVVASKKVTGVAKSSGVNLGYTNNQWNGNLGQIKNTNVGKCLEGAIDQAVAFCTAQIPNLHWTGDVVLVKGPQIYINRGEREGVSVGEVFKVGSADQIRDPATGELLDVSFNPVGQIKVETVREKVSICSVVSGDGIANGMSIEPL